MARYEKSNKFIEYVKHLHKDKNPMHHKCSLVKRKRPGTKKKGGDGTAFRVYDYLMLLPYNHYETKVYHESIDSVDHARREHITNYPFVLHPFSRLRLFLNLFIFVPYILSKIYFAHLCSFRIPRYIYISKIYITVGGSFIFFNFFTGISKKKKKLVELNPLSIFKSYILTYFIVDFGMILPNILGLIFRKHSFGIWNFIYLIPFFRSVTVVKTIESILFTFSINGRDVDRISLVIKILILLQGSACVMSYFKYLYGMFDYIYNSPDWRDDFTAYIDELITNLSRLYYSAYIEQSDSLMITLLTLVSVVAGTVAFAYVMAAVLIDLLAGVAQESKYHQIALEVQNFARQEHRDPVIRKRIVQMFDVIFLGTLLKEQRVKQTVPDNMRRDLNDETIGVLVRNTNVLSKLDRYLLLRILEKLKLVVLLPLDHLVTEGHTGDAMFFLSSGRLVRYRHSKELGHLDDGDNLAEDALFSEDFVHPESIVAGTSCFVYRLSRIDYQNCLNE